MGYGLNSEHTPLGVNDRTLWWAGWGGSMCVIDVENRLTVSYVIRGPLCRNQKAPEGRDPPSACGSSHRTTQRVPLPEECRVAILQVAGPT